MERISKMWRSGLAMLLALCLLISACPIAAFATEEPAKKYVSLGDSMTNGLGLGGGYDSTGHNGYLEIDKFSYPALVAENYGWDLTQLATSCMRLADLHYVLDYGTEGAYPGDNWTQKEMIGHRWPAAAEAADVFQTAIKEADVINMAAGDCDLGVYLMDMITSEFGMGYGYDYTGYNLEKALATDEVDAQTKSMAMKVHAEAMAYLADKLPNDLVKNIADRMSYVTANFMIHFNGAMSRMLELNGDAEFIILGLMNTMSGYEMDFVVDGEKTHVDFAALMDYIVNPLNAYLAGLPTAWQAMGKYPEAKFYYAELDRIETHAMTFAENYKAPDESGFPLMRDRFVKDIVDNGNGMIWGLVKGMLETEENPLYTPKLEDILTFEAVVNAEDETLRKQQFAGYAAANQDKLTSIVAYLAMENALLMSLENTPVIDLNAIKLPEGSYDIMGIVMANLGEGGLTMPVPDAALVAEFFEILKAANADAIEAQATAVAKGIAGAYWDFLTAQEKEDAVKNVMASDEFKANVEAMIMPGATLMATGYITPTELPASMNDNDFISALLNLYARLKLANGMSAHPNWTAHKNLAAEIIATYDNGQTAKDETKENLKFALGVLKDFLKENGPELADQAYQYLVEEGYVADAQKAVDDLIKYLEENGDDMMIAALEAAIEALKDEAAELLALVAPLNAELQAKLAERAAATSAEVIAEIDAAIEKIEAAIAAIDAQVKAINNEIVALNNTLMELVPAVESAAAQTAALTADAIALSESIVALVDTLKGAENMSDEELAAVYGAAREAVLNAIEILEGAIEVVNTDVAKSVALAEKAHGQVVNIHNGTVTVIEMLKALPVEVYEIVREAVEGITESLEEAAAQVKADLEEALAELNTLMMGYVDEKKAELNALRQEIENHIKEKHDELVKTADEHYNSLDAETRALIETLIAEAKAELIAAASDEENIAAVKAHIEAKKAELEAEYRPEIEAAIAELEAELAAKQAKAEEINAELQAKVAAAEAELKAKAEAIYAEVDAKVAEIRAEVEAGYAEAVAAIEAEIAALEAELTVKVAELNAKAEEEIANLTAEYAPVIAEAIAQTEEQLKVVNAYVEEVIAVIKDAFVRATTSDLALGRKSAYIALGDGTAASESYVDLVSARVKETYPVEKFHNYAEVGNTIGAEAAKVATRPGIADAAVITIGFGNVPMLDNAIRNAGKVNYDWAKLVGEDMVPYVKEALGVVNGKIGEIGLNEAWTMRLNSIVEGIAYAAVEYAIALPQLIAEIRTVNTDAVIVVVGQYNPLSGVTLDVGGATVDVSDYIDGFVTAVAAHGIGYALITGEAIFVEAPAVDTANTKTTLTEDDLVFDLLLNGFDVLYPSEAGDLYIANQILGALNMAQYDSENPFVDVHEDDWYYDAVLWAVEKGITNGTGDGTTFEPTTATSRAHIVTFLWRFAGCPEPKTTNMPFVDVPANDYFTKAVLWAAENGITNGTGDGTTFKPHEVCTRAQIVTMLARYMNGTSNGSKNPFKDVPADAFYTDAVLWAVQNGITTGVGDGTTFDPNGECWRAMVVTMMHRIWLQN